VEGVSTMKVTDVTEALYARPMSQRMLTYLSYVPSPNQHTYSLGTLEIPLPA
jgi:hypothetical protein